MNRCLALVLFTILVASSAPLAAADNPPAKEDNTTRIQRERAERTATAQSNKPEDIKTSQAIQQAVVSDGNLSFASKNVKIITVDGEVTLRGAVTSQQEKVLIEKMAKTTAGETRVVSQLQVTK